MKVTEHLAKAEKTLLSLEILPPLKGKSISGIYDVLDHLIEFNPSFINVTYHRSEYIYKKRGDDRFDKVFIRKRPGTVGICAAIQFKYKIDAVAHIICGGFTKEETEDALIDLSYLSIDNVLLLRGDASKNERDFIAEPGGHKYASELVKQVVNMNNGIYLEEDSIQGYKTDFNIGVAGYPEKHFESPNLKSDLQFLKQKVEAGADYIVTQMFYDNQQYFDFVKKCREEGINIPIIPGIKPITAASQIHSIPRTFHVDIPETLSDEIDNCKTAEAVKAAGVKWCIQQSQELVEAGAPCIHYYTMGNVDAMRTIVDEVF
ncbi:MAG: methylenetetrahydrofolate reductase [NAD(P)H] [Chitinophagaceae bacterium]